MRAIALLCLIILSVATHASAAIETVPSLDLGRYLGTWYEIARNPIIFEPKCACARQLLTSRPDGKVEVYNSCNKGNANGPLTEIRGEASPVNASDTKLSVDFGFIWRGDYWVIALDPEYRYAVVTDLFGYSLYILSKTPTLDPALYEEAVASAKQQVSVKRLQITLQEGCTYPAAE